LDDKYNHSRTEVLGSDGSLIMCRKLLGSLFLVFFAARRGRTAAKVHAGKDEDAPNDFRAEDDFERGETWYEPIVGNEGQESVEKHFPAYQLLGLLCINVL